MSGQTADWRRLTGIGPSSPVKVVLNVQVSLHFLVEREHLRVGPFVVAEGSPGVEVLWETLFAWLDR